MIHDNAISPAHTTSPTANVDPLATSTHMPPARFFQDGTALN
ncbi:replicase, partial [Pseudomonas amygdali pv. aesculi str. 0893_23]